MFDGDVRKHVQRIERITILSLLLLSALFCLLRIDVAFSKNAITNTTVGNGTGNTVGGFSIPNLTTSNINIGRKFDIGLSITRDGSTIYTVSGRDPGVLVINAATGAVIKTIDPDNKSETFNDVMVIDDYLYLCDTRNLQIMSLEHEIIMNSFRFTSGGGGGTDLARIILSPDRKTVYAMSGTGRNILVIDTATQDLISSVDVFINGNAPSDMAISPSGDKIYVVSDKNTTDVFSGWLSIIDTKSLSVISTRHIAQEDSWHVRVDVRPSDGNVYILYDEIFSNKHAIAVLDALGNDINTLTFPSGEFWNLAFSKDSNFLIVEDQIIDINTSESRGINLQSSTHRIISSFNGVNILIINGDVITILKGFNSVTSPAGPNLTPTPTPAGPTPIITPTPPLTPIVTPTPTPGPDAKPRAAFKADPVSGLAPLRVKFTDESTGNPSSWIWNFGDGDLGNKKNPIHVYKAAGVYSVELTVSNSEGKDTVIRKDLIEAVGTGDISNCVAEFNAKPESGLAPLTVKFDDLSTGKPASWTWDFGDGDLAKTRNPSHTYRKAGTYTVSLSVSTSCGEETVTKKDLISVKAGKEVIADFKVNARSGLAQFQVEFEDLSSGGPESWAWDFGDGNASGDQHPTHTYKNPGVYSPSLKVSNSNGSDAITKPELIEVESTSPPRADFTAAPQAGFGPLQVKFRDRSTGNVSGWAWDFGDGTQSSLRNPVHAYLSPDKYTVKLIASGSSGSADKTERGLIEVLEGSAPTAAFTGEPRSGFAPLTVQFKDISGGKVSSWAWEFGDGGKSRDQNPTHVYERVGVYSVKLTSSGAEGSAEKEETDFIEALDKGTAADFTADRTTRIKGETGEYVVKFKDLSSSSHGKIAKWFWSFGDKGGGASAQPNPEHVFNCDNNSDVFTVSLTIFDSENNVANEVKPAFISCEEVEVVEADAAPDATPDPNPGAPLAAEFRAENTNGPAPLEVRFIDESKGSPKSWSWDFGDGEESAERNPSHIYTSKGKYTVGLIVSNDSGIDSITKKKLINVKKGEGGKGCPASVALENEAGAPSYSRKLNALRLFRDNVIGNTVAGLKLIKYYYYHSTEVEDILNADPELKADASEVLNRLIIELQNFSSRNTIKQVVNKFLSPGLVSDATALLDKIAARGSDELKAAIGEARGMMEARSE